MSSSEIALLGHQPFWEAEEVVRTLPGIVDATVGYAGGTRSHPTYHTKDDHLEAVRVEFMPHKVSYEELLHHFIKRIFGHSQALDEEQLPASRSCPAIFYIDERQRASAEQVWQEVSNAWGALVPVRILPATNFYPAEEYHQRFLAKLRGDIDM